MPTLLDDHIADLGELTAIRDDHGAWTWRELGNRVDRWIALLTARGLGEGDHLACLVGNRHEAYEVLLACLHVGITVVPVNWHLTAPEARHIVSDSGSRALVADAERVEVAAAAGDGCPVRLVTGERDLAGFTAVEPALAAAAAAAPRECSGAVMLYTSGTTGAPKGVVSSMFQRGAPLARVSRLTRFSHATLDVPVRERTLLDGPWYHSSQLFFSLLSLLQGSTLVVHGRFDPARTLEAIDREQITSVNLVPTQMLRLLRLPEAVRDGFSGASLRRVWHTGGPCPHTVKRRMIDWWGPVLVECYGATEGGAVTRIDSRDWLRRPGSVGRAMPGIELLVVGEDGAPLPPGVTGRVYVRRPGRQGFHYHNAPGKTRAAHLPTGEFTFGDVGHLDEEGFLFLTGRAQDLIISGGVNVYPAEVEAVLLAHPAVRDVAVVAVPDEEFGEKVAALVEAEPGAGGGLADELDRFCRLSLAGFKTPRLYRFVDLLPREPTGKIRKDLLQTLLPVPEQSR